MYESRTIRKLIIDMVPLILASIILIIIKFPLKLDPVSNIIITVIIIIAFIGIGFTVFSWSWLRLSSKKKYWEILEKFSK